MKELAGYLAGKGLAGAAGVVYFMEKSAGSTSPLTDMLDEIIKEASVNEKKAELVAQEAMREDPRLMDLPREDLMKMAAYVEAVHSEEPFENRVAILEDLVKKASEPYFQKRAGIEQILPGALTALGVGAGLMGTTKALDVAKNTVNYHKFTAVFNYVVKHNEMLKHEYERNPQKIRSFAETIFDFAPRVALDPNLLSTVLANAAMGSSLDPQTINSLAMLEGNVTRSRNEASLSSKFKTGINSPVTLKP